MKNILLEVKNLSVAFKDDNVVDGISFEITAGKTFALVGESGSGKSLTALSILRLLPPNAKLTADNILLQQQELLKVSELDFCKVRGKRIGLIFQDPMSSLNPVMNISDQVAEVLKIHFNLSKAEIKARVLELLQQVEIPEPERRMTEYPHQLSGGQRQRIMIAIALAAKPDLLIADEPTTALDVTIQAQILDLLKNIQQQTGMALWIISHDLALVSNIADKVAVMQHGKIVESADSQQLFNHPQHSYTKKLLAALPSLENCLQQERQKQAALLKVSDFKVYYPIHQGIFKRVVDHVRAVDGVDFELQRGKTLALVGESGCGKTTLGKALLNLIPATSGQVLLDDLELNQLTGEELRQKRAEIQIVFQDPFAAMNPRMLVGEIIAEGIRALHPDKTQLQINDKVSHLLQQVDLPEESALRYPHEFSGGQRQRICIARALAVEPKLIVCDEPTSALDVSVQAQIIELLKSLQQQQGISYLFITHDLAVVAEIADEIAVMYQGKIVEQGLVKQVLNNPQHAYSRRLLAAVPELKKEF
ncbi:MAG: dipeptide ABC transporter ATP-binding protein [Methylococcaceae bacterium]|nr:dipeptide ABC transporter ATP-binding protein [Methylococcaceae bacterium]